MADTGVLRAKGPGHIYRQVKSGLLEGMIRGDCLAGGDKLLSLANLARKFDVSIMSVRLAVKELERDGILRTVPSRGVYLRKNREDLEDCLRTQTAPLTMGLVFQPIFDLSGYYLSEIIKGVTERARTLSVNIQMFPFLRDTLRKKAVDGLIFGTRMSDEETAFVQAEGLPCVAIGNELSGPKAACVVGDTFLHIMMLAEHIAFLGCRKIALIGPYVRSDYVEELKELCAYHGIAIDGNMVRTEPGNEGKTGYAAAREIIPDKPDLIFTAGVETTTGVLSALREAGVSFPKDVRLIASVAGGSETIALNNITAMEVPLHDIAGTAVELLLKIIRGQPYEKRIAPRDVLVIRGSCGFPMEGKEKISVSSMTELRQLHQGEAS